MKKIKIKVWLHGKDEKGYYGMPFYVDAARSGLTDKISDAGVFETGTDGYVKHSDMVLVRNIVNNDHRFINQAWAIKFIINESN